MGFADQYLGQRSFFSGLITSEPASDLKIITIIPVFNESGLLKSLDSLLKAGFKHGTTEVICLFNHPVSAISQVKENNRRGMEAAKRWSEKNKDSSCHFHFLFLENINNKDAGVGYARKVLMDEASRRFNFLNFPDGIITSLDADCEVDPDYFESVFSHFYGNPGSEACSIYFEHPLRGNEFNPEVYHAITHYELHLRYYLQGLRYSGHPNCFHTVGSAFAVKAGAYCRQGGMNRRKAGEDFYFLQKFFDIGKFTECNSTTVRPSPRPSERVPFGTGPVVKKYLECGEEILSYNPSLFEMLRQFTTCIKKLEDPAQSILSCIEKPDNILGEFLLSSGIEGIISEIADNTSDADNFLKRFFRWFNMFRVLKFLNYGKKYFPDQAVEKAARHLLEIKGIKTDGSPAGLLGQYRWLEKNNI